MMPILPIDGRGGGRNSGVATVYEDLRLGLLSTTLLNLNNPQVTSQYTPFDHNFFRGPYHIDPHRLLARRVFTWMGEGIVLSTVVISLRMNDNHCMLQSVGEPAG
jgi:hypothetical protein